MAASAELSPHAAAVVVSVAAPVAAADAAGSSLDDPQPANESAAIEAAIAIAVTRFAVVNLFLIMFSPFLFYQSAPTLDGIS